MALFQVAGGPLLADPNRAGAASIVRAVTPDRLEDIYRPFRLKPGANYKEHAKTPLEQDAQSRVESQVPGPHAPPGGSHVRRCSRHRRARGTWLPFATPLTRPCAGTIHGIFVGWRISIARTQRSSNRAASKQAGPGRARLPTRWNPPDAPEEPKGRRWLAAQWVAGLARSFADSAFTVCWSSVWTAKCCGRVAPLHPPPSGEPLRRTSCAMSSRTGSWRVFASAASDSRKLNADEATCRPGLLDRHDDRPCPPASARVVYARSSTAMRWQRRSRREYRSRNST